MNEGQPVPLLYLAEEAKSGAAQPAQTKVPLRCSCRRGNGAMLKRRQQHALQICLTAHSLVHARPPSGPQSCCTQLGHAVAGAHIEQGAGKALFRGRLPEHSVASRRQQRAPLGLRVPHVPFPHIQDALLCPGCQRRQAA